MISWEIKGDGAVVHFLDQLGGRTIAKVNAEVGVQTLRVSRLAQAKASGGVLKLKTGQLRDAIGRGTSVKTRAGGVTGTVGLEGASKEVAIAGGAQEFGANIPAHIVEALAGHKLRFQVNGKWVVAQRVQLPAVKIPEHSFLRSSLDELRSSILHAIGSAAEGNWGIL